MATVWCSATAASRHAAHGVGKRAGRHLPLMSTLVLRGQRPVRGFPTVGLFPVKQVGYGALTIDLAGGAMKAMTYRGPYKVRIEEKDIPPIEHPNDAIVRVELAAICGSDLHLYHGLMPDTRVGHTFGHEFIGVVEEVGSSVENVNVGDRVMVPFNIYCGSCYFCARGLY